MRDIGVRTYALINYFDVWGNEKDGWDINDCCVEFDDLQIADDATPKDICEYLRKIGFLTSSDMRRLTVEDMGEMIEIYEKKTMKPLCSLREVVNK